MGASMSDYRKKAEECLRAAEKMCSKTSRMAMLGIARNYMSLAEYAAHADRTDESLATQGDGWSNYPR